MADKETIVLLRGAGAREMAIAHALSESPKVDRIIIAPGRSAMSQLDWGKPIETVPEIGLKNSSAALVKLCQEREVTLAIVNQDDAVAAGDVNALRAAGLLAFGHTNEAGLIESSKIGARLLGYELGLNQPRFAPCDFLQQAAIFAAGFDRDAVFYAKADDLAEGKGAVRADGREELLSRFHGLKKQFPDAAKRIIVEEAILNDDGTPGEEFSYFAMVNGREVRKMADASDQKQVDPYDRGPNTGSMGSSSPSLLLAQNPDLERQVERDVNSMAKGLADRGMPLTGVLYYSGMAVRRGRELKSYIVEWNGRDGDTEAQAIYPRLKNRARLFDLFMAIAQGRSIAGFVLETSDISTVALTLASKGYPGNYDDVKGSTVYGIESARKHPFTHLYPAGLEYDQKTGIFKAAGGRLVTFVGKGNNPAEAKAGAMHLAGMVFIDGNNGHIRHDVAFRDIQRYYASQRTI